MTATFRTSRSPATVRALTPIGCLLFALTACGDEEPELPSNEREPAAQVSTPVAVPKVVGQTTILSAVAGPARERMLPFYGTDLGWAFAHNDELWVMFGDTWLTWISNEIAEDADDALGKISLKDFPNGDAVDRWVADHPATSLLAPRWHALGPTLRIETGPDRLPIPMRPSRGGVSLSSGPALTPMAGFSNGRKDDKAGVFAFFLRNEPVACAADGSCENGFECDKGLGQCAPLGDLSAPCVLGTTSCDCVPIPTGPGLCQDRTSSVYGTDSERGRSHAVVMRQVVGNALRGADTKFPGQSWDTRRFYNLTARTVNDFDPTRSGGERNDYKVADGVDPAREGVFIWGRPNFGGPSALGRGAQMYLAWVKMPEYDEAGTFAFKPRFFTGFDAGGRPMFGEREVEAVPIDLDASQEGVQADDELDVVGQMSISWLPSQKRWVMFYGNVGGNRLMRLIFGSDLDAMKRDPLGSIYVRFAPNPWGPWTPPKPLLVGGNPDVGVVGLYGPGGVMFHGSCFGLLCAPPELAFFGQAKEWGALYAPGIVDPWTTERPNGEVDVYWHLSSWNPYQVLLARSRLPAP